MNSKVLSEPKTMEQLVTYWAWKVLDLDRMIKVLQSYPPFHESLKFEVKDAVIKRVADRNLIESLQRRHRNGEF